MTATFTPCNRWHNFLEVNFLSEEIKRNVPEPKRTPEGKYQCPEDNEVYDNESDYEAHCQREHQQEQ
jgi:hypothetical protein